MDRGKLTATRANAGKTVLGAGAASVLVLLYYYAKMNGLGERDEFGLGAGRTAHHSKIDAGLRINTLHLHGDRLGNERGLRHPLNNTTTAR